MLIEIAQEDAQKMATLMAHSMIGGEAIEIQKILNEIGRLTNLLLEPFKAKEKDAKNKSEG